MLIIFTFEVFISKEFYIFKKKFFIVSVIFVTYLVIITYLNNSLTNTLKAFFLFRFFLIPLIFYYFFQRIDFDKKKILIYYSFILIFLSLDLLFQKIFNFNFLGFKPSLWNDTYGYERYAGFFDQELIAGGYLVNFGIISTIIYISIFNYTKKNLTIFFSIFTFVLIGIYITGDRTPIIILLSFIVLGIIFFKKIRIIFIPIFSILIVCLIIGINLIDIMKARFIDYPYSRLFEQNFSVKGYEVVNENNQYYKKILRNNPWGRHYLVSFEMILAKPYFGHGLKSFRKYCKDYNYTLDVKYKSNKDIKIIHLDGCSTHPHNYILEIILDSGLIGLILIITIFFFVLQLAFKSTSNKLYVLNMIMFIMALTSPFKPSGSFFSSWTSAMLWFMIALIYLFTKKKQT